MKEREGNGRNHSQAEVCSGRIYDKEGKEKTKEKKERKEHRK